MIRLRAIHRIPQARFCADLLLPGLAAKGEWLTVFCPFKTLGRLLKNRLGQLRSCLIRLHETQQDLVRQIQWFVSSSFIYLRGSIKSDEKLDDELQRVGALLFCQYCGTRGSWFLIRVASGNDI